MKYSYNFVLETQHGCYPLGEWCFCGSRLTLEEAVQDCQQFGDGYRVVDSFGTVLYPPLADDDLVKMVVDIQVRLIEQQNRFKDAPLANPGLLPEHKQNLDALWQEAIERGLNLRIIEEVKRIIGNAKVA